MRIDIITLFPEYFGSSLNLSTLRLAQEKGLVSFYLHQLRHWARDRHGTVDDTPYGGGPGMVLRVDVVKRALDAVAAQGPKGEKPWAILLTPQGESLTQAISQELARKDRLILICGRYEGFDERICPYVDQDLSIGPYVLSGGEAAALVVIDSLVRLLPGVTGHPNSPQEESFALTDESGRPLLEYPQYTRPEEFAGQPVPEILLSGNHGAISQWRLQEAKKRTAARRPKNKAAG